MSWTSFSSKLTSLAEVSHEAWFAVTLSSLLVAGASILTVGTQRQALQPPESIKAVCRASSYLQHLCNLFQNHFRVCLILTRAIIPQNVKTSTHLPDSCVQSSLQDRCTVLWRDHRPRHHSHRAADSPHHSSAKGRLATQSDQKQSWSSPHEYYSGLCKKRSSQSLSVCLFSSCQ